MTTAPANQFDRLRSRLLDEALLWISLVLAAGVVIDLAMAARDQMQRQLFAAAMPAALLLAWSNRHRLSYGKRIAVLLLMLFVNTYVEAARAGPFPLEFVFVIPFALIAMLFLGDRLAWWLIAGNTLGLVVFGVAGSQGWLFDPIPDTRADHPLAWLHASWLLTSNVVVVALVGRRMIQGRRVLEIETREQAERLRKIADNVPGLIYQFLSRADGTACFPYASDSSVSIFGLAPEVLKDSAEPAFARVHPDDLSEVKQKMLASARDLESLQDCFRILHPQRGILWVERHATPERLDNGDTLWHGFMHDVTAARRAERRLAATLENSPGVVMQWFDQDGRICYWNAASESLFGWTAEEAVGKTLDQLMISGDQAREFVALLAGIESGGKRIGLSDFAVNDRDGMRRIVSATVFAIDGGNEPLFACIGVDMTERANLQRMQRDILESMPEAVVLCNSAGVITLVNHQALAMFGYAREELVGEFVEILLPERLRAMHPDHRQRYMGTARARAMGTNQALNALAKDGREIPVDVSLGPVQARGETFVLAVLRDVSERQSIDRALRQSEARYRDMLESSSDWIWEIDAQWIYTFSSAKVTDLLGYRPEEVLGRSPFDFMPAEEAQRVEAVFAEAIKARRGFQNLVNINVHRTGRLVVLETSGVPVVDAHGAFCGYRGVDRDITERKAIEQALRMERDRAQRYLDTVQTIVISLDRRGQIETINRKGCELLGYEAWELQGRNWLEQCLPEGKVQAADRAVFRDLMAGDGALGSRYFETQVLRRDGSQCLIAWHGAPVLDEAGVALSYLASGEDITERRQSELRLRNSEARFRFAVEGTGDGVWDWNILGGEMHFSGRYMAMLGYGENELPAIEKTWVDSVHPDDLPRVRENLNGYLKGQLPNYSAEMRLRCKDGSYRWILCRGMIVARDHAGTPIRMTGIHTDISARKQVELELAASRESVDKVSQAKSAFLASMSHELRTPLNAIAGFSQMLEIDAAPVLSPEQREALGHIRAGTRHALAMLNDLLDLSRIESGQLKLDIDTVALAPLIEEAVALSLPAAKERQIVIEQFCPDNLHARADRSRVRQVLLNLLSNAIKYNRDGGAVHLSCVVAENHVRLTVANTGKGIPEDRRSDVFQPFRRLGAERGAIEGAGIGLSICKRLIEAMAGAIGYHSTEGLGSRFWVELPLASATMPAPADPAPADPAGSQAAEAVRLAAGRVLYVEDSPINVNVMRHIFRKMPEVELLIAENAEDAIAGIREASPDLVLLDINLPGMSGLEALSVLKSDPDTRRIPVIAVSAAAMPSDIAAGLEAGFQAYLTKPFDVIDLINRVRAVLRGAGASQSN